MLRIRSLRWSLETSPAVEPADADDARCLEADRLQLTHVMLMRFDRPQLTQ